MIDTLRFNVPGSFKTPTTHHPVIRFTQARTGLIQPPGLSESTCLSRIPSFGQFRALECSLPKLLYGHNGRLISSQAELDAGLDKLWHEVTRLADCPPLPDWQLWRIDLVWQFGGLHAGRVVDALSGFRYPAIRKPPMHIAGQSLSFRGAQSRFGVTFYDKPHQQKADGDVLRIEVKLAGKQLIRLKARDWQNFGHLYQTYREVVMNFPVIPKPSTSSNWQTALAVCVPPEFHEQFLASLKTSPRSQRAYRQKVRLGAAKLPETIRWSDLLPEDTPPAPVNVEPRKRQPRQPRQTRRSVCTPVVGLPRLLDENLKFQDN